MYVPVVFKRKNLQHFKGGKWMMRISVTDYGTYNTLEDLYL